MYYFDRYFWLEITITYTTKQSIILFINLFSTSCVNFLCNDILLMHKTYRPSMFSVLTQLKDLISENIKYPNKVKIVGKGGCFQHHFSEK